MESHHSLSIVLTDETTYLAEIDAAAPPAAPDEGEVIAVDDKEREEEFRVVRTRRRYWDSRYSDAGLAGASMKGKRSGSHLTIVVEGVVD